MVLQAASALCICITTGLLTVATSCIAAAMHEASTGQLVN
jgi:hypothetical protein